MTEEIRAAAAALREFALGLPEAQEEFPWGERVVKVNKKIFVFLGSDATLEQALAFGVKLPISGEEVLTLPFAKPSGYGLGKSGWVSLRFLPDEILPVDLLTRWIEESYRAVAPKRLVAQLDNAY
jgi:predicted DNA-binding protein (MmcQ/YjbR family)